MRFYLTLLLGLHLQPGFNELLRIIITNRSLFYFFSIFLLGFKGTYNTLLLSTTVENTDTQIRKAPRLLLELVVYRRIPTPAKLLDVPPLRGTFVFPPRHARK